MRAPANGAVPGPPPRPAASAVSPATVDHARAVAVVDGIVRASDLAPHVVGSPVVRVEGGLVEVEITLQADYVFARAIPGTADGIRVRAAASAQAARP